MKHLHILTNSERETWRTCQARHHYAYTLLLRPLETAEPLWAGNILHDGIRAGWRAAWESAEYSQDERLARAISAAEREICGQIDTARGEQTADVERLAEMGDVLPWTVAHYFEVCAADLQKVPLIIEGQFSNRIRNAAGVAGYVAQDGKIDLALWDLEANAISLEDHKGTGAPVQSWESRIALNSQLSGYLLALKEMVQSGAALGGTPAAARVVAANREKLSKASVGSVGFNVLRRSKPGSPSVNLLRKGQCTTSLHAELLEQQNSDGIARGEVSVAKIDTLAETYNQALEEQFFARELPMTEKQLALRDALRARGDTFFLKVELYRGPDELERWRKEFWIEAAQIRQAKRQGSPVRNPNACADPRRSRCPYESICLAPDVLNASRVPPGYRIAATPHEELSDGNQEKTDGEDWQETF